MWKLLGTKTFWVGVATALTGLGGGIALIVADPPQVIEGVAAIWAALALGGKAITQRHSNVKLEEKIDKVLFSDPDED